MGEGEVSGKSGFIKWFSELNKEDLQVAGGKGASLAEMYNSGFPVPPGFMVSVEAFRYFIEKSGLGKKIEELISGINIEDTANLEEKAKEIREMIINSELPGDLREDIVEAYEILDVDKKGHRGASEGALSILKMGHEPPFVAVRSSATAEDLEGASFAGQQDTFLNIKGKVDLLESVRKCFASLYTARAVYYRKKKGFDKSDVGLAVVVQKMVDSQKSGVIFSKNPVKNDGSVLIEAVFGLGEGIVSGKIKPDQYIVNPGEDFEIANEEISKKTGAVVRDSSGHNTFVALTEDRGKQKVLSNYEIKILAQHAEKLEEHYGKPQDIEFAIEGEEIYIVQSRPITTLGKGSGEPGGEISGEVLVTGLGASPGVRSGRVRIIRDISELRKVEKGDVMVTKMTNPDMVVSMQKAAGIVTDEGGITSHAAIVSREMGIPAVVGTQEATEKLEEGTIVSVDGSSGKVYAGEVEERAVVINPIVKTKTKIKVIVDLPDYAERAAKSQAKSVGLLRLEGIIASSGKHPLYYFKSGKLNEYTEVLYEGIKKIAESFEEVWIRTSDLRSDEFRNLEGSPDNIEGNPMLGDHGIRFSLKNPGILDAELKAVKRVSEELNNKRFGIMVPQVIGVPELKETKETAKKVGLSLVKIGIMVETPAAVQVINDICEEGLDFISFGTNDLTQYTLAIDRNNPSVQDLYDEMNPAILSSLTYVIRRCKKYGVETSICGQAASRPEMAKFLVEQGIDSISVNADAAAEISKVIAGVENPESGNLGEEEKVESPENEGPLIVQNVEEEKEVEALGETKNEPTQDIEDSILQELDDTEVIPEEPEPEIPEVLEEDLEVPRPSEIDEVEDEYSPAIERNRENDDIPPLGEPGNEVFDENKEEDEILDIF